MLFCFELRNYHIICIIFASGAKQSRIMRDKFWITSPKATSDVAFGGEDGKREFRNLKHSVYPVGIRYPQDVFKISRTILWVSDTHRMFRRSFGDLET